MKFRENPNLEAALRDAADTVRLLRSLGAEDMAANLESLVKSVTSERFVIGVIGATKRGKSTLVNGLLGRGTDECAPIGRKPATSVISIFGHGPGAECRVCFKGGDHKAISESEIRLYATEEHNPGNRKSVRSIECVAPFEGLEPGVFLVDTPGAGNALEEMHNEILLGFLPNADAVVFLVTAEEPLTESELNLLRAVRAKDIKKVFFAINMVDRVDSGDLDADALAQGIEHNRKALASLESRDGVHSFATPKFYTISAKRFHEKQRDAGTEELAGDIRASIRQERVAILSQKLRERTRSVLEECERDLGEDLREATASEADLRLEIESLKKARKELERGRLGRETEFRREWSAAFSTLADSLASIRQKLHSEYAQKIEATSGFKLAGLTSTIHADVTASFSELMAMPMEECESSINQAQKKLHEHAFSIIIQTSTQLHSVTRVSSVVKASMEAGLSTLPSLLTGTVTASLPGWVGAMISSAAPVVTTFTGAAWLPWNWAAAASAVATGSASAVVHGTAAVVGTTLAVVATPLSILAFGVSVYRLVDTWRSQQDKKQNQLVVSVRELIDEAYKQVQEQLKVYRDQDGKLLDDYQVSIVTELARIEDHLEGAVASKPDESTIRALEQKHRLLTDHRARLLEGPAAEKGGSDSPQQRAIVDSLLSNS
jgi:GTPase Era involved in 16S rRNA processing